MANINIQRPGKDPLLECDYLIEISGVADVGFMEYGTIKKTTATAEYREGNGPNYKFKQDGLESVEAIVLRRGIFRNDHVVRDLYDSRERRTIDVVHLSHGREGNRRARVERLYEARMTILDEGKGDAMSEDANRIGELEITFETFDIDP